MKSIPKPERIIDRKYREWIKTKPCVLRGVFGIYKDCFGLTDPAHISPMNGTKSAASKVSDYRCLPLCRGHHTQVGSGNLHRRCYFDECIREFNAEYFQLHPANPSKERILQPEARIKIRHCVCKRSHELPLSKVRVWRGEIEFNCPLRHQKVSARA